MHKRAEHGEEMARKKQKTETNIHLQVTKLVLYSVEG